MSNLIEVVGTMFFRNGKLLIDKPRSKPTFQMIGGKVDDGETTREAAIRECHEELSNTLKNEIVLYCIKKGLIK